ncbi:MAG: hypothetical protein ACREJ3_10055 [Polyangiaceae bacterium]
MYRLLKLAGSLATWKINYCTADYSRCERYKLSAAGRHVPINLMPNGALLRVQPSSSGHLRVAPPSGEHLQVAPPSSEKDPRK